MKRRVVWGSILGLTVLMLLIGGWVYMTEIRPTGLYFEKNHQVAQRLEELNQTAPPGVPPEQWSELTKLTTIAFGNVFYSPQQVNYAELERFQHDLDKKLLEDSPPRLETLRWVWKRLGETGPHGKDYCDRMVQIFDEAAAQIPAAT